MEQVISYDAMDDACHAFEKGFADGIQGLKSSVMYASGAEIYAYDIGYNRGAAIDGGVHSKPKATSSSMPYDVDHVFKYHALKGGQPEKHTLIRQQAALLAKQICLLCPESRERAVALTNLETSIMWANASIARNE